MSLIVLVAGAIVGFGLVLGRSAWTDAPIAKQAKDAQATALQPIRLGVGLAAGALAALATGWPVVALAAAVGGYVVAGLSRGGRRSVKADIERTEALATWAEMLRDTLVAGQGITETIRSTAEVAPAAIRADVQRLARRVQHQRLTPALAEWADDMHDATADLIASVLTLAATRSGRDIGALLGALADVSRQRVAMRLRIDARRASTRSEARTLVGFSVGFFAFLTFFSGSFVRPYEGAGGQLVLAIVVLIAGVAIWWLRQLSRFQPVARVLTLQQLR